MRRNGYQLWTLDMLVGAAIVIIGVVALLVRLDLLVLKWSVALPPLFAHLWPFLLIGSGILWLLDSKEPRDMHNDRYVRSGERQ
jgi:hypothetical protein